jgi:SPP1 gp7 family putative phage head morphogenesis protein
MATNANTQIYDKTVNRAAMIRLYEKRVNGKVELVINGHTIRLDKLIKEAKLSPKGFEALQEAIDKELLRTYKETFNISKRSLLDLAVDQLSFAYQNVETAMGSIWKTERPQRRVAEEIVLERPLIENKNLAAGWSGVSFSEKKRLEALIRKGIAEGNTVDEIALAVRKGNIHNITMMQSKALVVTAITSVHAQADHEIYEANKKAITGWQYVAVLDTRTTPLCAHRDGHIYPIGDKIHLPPAHYNCRSTTIPVFKSWEDIAKLEGVAQVRRRNIEKLSKEQIAFYDGQTPLKESYNDWLLRQPREIQYTHLGDYQKVDLLNTGKVSIDKFTNDAGKELGIRELRAATDSTYEVSGDTIKFANAKKKLDAMQLGASNPDDLIDSPKLRKTLLDYYILQTKELEGTLSYTNYRGTLLHNKKATRNRVLNSPPKEEQLKFNPSTGRYEDVRLYQPSPTVLANNLKLVDESKVLLDRDKVFIRKFVEDLSDTMSVNERAVVTDNLRIIFGRYRSNKEIWANFKAVVQSQIKFDVMNVSDSIETQLRKDTDLMKRLLQDNYIDPVLGVTQLNDLHDNFISNIMARNKWEDKTAPTIAKELRSFLDPQIPLKIRSRLSEDDLNQFYLRFAHRLSMADSPDRDQFAVMLGRDLYNMANLNGWRKQWFELGMKILESKKVDKFFQVETFGVQKRRMKSRLSGAYFGPYYDTLAYNIRVTDPRIQEYARLNRKVELGLRVSVTQDSNRLLFREGYKTYWIDRGILGLEDTRIPITSTSSFSEFPEEFLDNKMIDALTWASKTKYKVDEDFYDFVDKLLYFKDDRGKAQFYDERNEYRKYIASRGDSYERFKAMQWLRSSGKSFSNHPFIDHRARVYDRGLIGPQSGETFRPFLNTAESKNFSPEEFEDFQDQIGAFLGGLNDTFEGRFNSLSITGRQKVADKWRPELVRIGNLMLSKKPNDIRAILESNTVSLVDGEELGKFFRFAIETAKIDNYLGGNYSKSSLEKLRDYKISLALEQDASSSGAQIIALTTRNKQLAELSNVVPTTQKRRLYDEIAAATFNDPRFKVINEKLGLTEKDLRKAAKAQNMVTFYGAGERTGILNVEGKLSKVLGKDKATLVVKASDRETVLNEISARIARYERFDPVTADELRVLRENVKDIFNKGIDPGDEILEQLYFLDPKTKDLVEKLSLNYDRVVTPNDFKDVAKIMSEHLREQVPILKDFTRFFGRLAEDYLKNAKPSESSFDWKTVTKARLVGVEKKGFVLPDLISRIVGVKAGEPLSEKLIKRLSFYKPDSNLHDILYGVKSPEARRIGGKFFKLSFIRPSLPTPGALVKGELLTEQKVLEVELLNANKLPKAWTNVPWVNFDGKVIEQNFTQQFEERLFYKNKDGEWTSNILQVPQKTELTWWEELLNKDGKINDIADATRARTAFAVNGNHSNDAVIVKNFHLWGKDNNIPTSTIHDAFFTNAADMLNARNALRKIYAKMLDRNIIISTLNEMRDRGLPQELYDQYLEEAIQIGLVPIAGKSVVGGKVLKESDILNKDDILKEIPKGFKNDYGWYGVG